MKVSIIVPVYNSAKYLQECLDSLLAQTHKDIEIIAIDDGSEDKSLKILKKYARKDERIKAYTKPHEGSNFARKSGVEEATGDYCMFVDSDDFLKPNAVKKLVDILERRPYDIIRFAGRTDENLPLKNDYPLPDGRHRKVITAEEARVKLLETNALNNLCFQIYKRSLLENPTVFSEQITNCEDFLANLVIYDQVKKIFVIDTPLYYYRRNSTSTTKRLMLGKRQNNLSDMLVAFSRAAKYLEAWGFKETETFGKFYLRALDMFRDTIMSAYADKSDFMEITTRTFSNPFFAELRSQISPKELGLLLKGRGRAFYIKHAREIKWIYYGEYEKLYKRYNLLYRRRLAYQAGTLGKYMRGRLGNQLFQYAALRQIQEKNGGSDRLLLNFSRYVYSKGFDDGLKDFNTKSYEEVRRIHFTPAQLFEILRYKVIKRLRRATHPQDYYTFRARLENKDRRKLQDKGIYWKEDGKLIMGASEKKRKVAIGHFESSANFDKIRPQLLEELTPKKPPLKKNRALYGTIENTNSVCVSVRRGDFVSNPEFAKKFNVCGPVYFKRATAEIKKRVKDPTFIIFSDDVEWCRQNLKIPGKVYYEDGTDPVWEKLRLMYSCKHFIISNSTFSWWAQYLSRNDDKVVIAPAIWREDGYCKDIYEKDWILIQNRSGNE